MDLQTATFAGGCFWCTEAIFQTLKGVRAVRSGYTGGHKAHPSYMEICNGDTGHAEAIEITYRANEISFDELLLIFFKTHNPTTINQQGNDTGTQYRSAVFYHTDEQKQHAEAMIEALTARQVFEKPIVTKVLPASIFYMAEEHHQNYFQQNIAKPYCVYVIQPKFNRFAKEFTGKIKAEYL